MQSQPPSRPDGSAAPEGQSPAGHPRIGPLVLFLSQNPDDAQARFLLGYEYNKLRRYADAVEVLLPCVETEPTYAAAWKQLGDAYRRLDQAAAALRAYERGAEVARAAGNDHTARECETLAARLRDKSASGD